VVGRVSTGESRNPGIDADAPVPHYGRGIIIHEATHQYHGLTLPKYAMRRLADWYYEGVATDCQNHHLTDQTLEIMLPAGQTFPEMANVALARMRDQGFSPRALPRGDEGRRNTGGMGLGAVPSPGSERSSRSVVSTLGGVRSPPGRASSSV
jgi:hypothetical protein